MKIKKGDVINELSLPSVDGSVFDLESIKGKKSLISFYRYSSCPFCHLRINETINNKENFGENFETIAVFNCTLESLQKSSTKHDSSIYILADEERFYFDKYNVEKSGFGVFLGSIIGFFRFMKAIFVKGFNPLTSLSGAFTGLPVDVLVDESGVVQDVKYGKTTIDHIPMSDVISFSKT
jgi:peroxiredoxin|uniref:MedDCM-OCT-S31-C2-cds41 n=1 Tax=Candidatus Actinomarina minuta TaxID=1389454 RepID=S5DJX9_9ACTN|nr:MedDCM-OCT-S31-C2-cds41 [Candidatus Actinomarina minuta]